MATTVAPAAPSDEAAPLGSSKVSLDDDKDKDQEVAKVGTTTGENKKNSDGTGGGEGGKEEDSSREAMEAMEAMKRKRKASEDACLQKAAVARAAIEAQEKLSSLPKLQEVPLRNHTHWDYVMKEMEWMAYDFAQERRFKLQTARAVAAECANQPKAKEHLRVKTPAKTPATNKKKKPTKAEREKAAAAAEAAAAALVASPPPSPDLSSTSFFFGYPAEDAVAAFYAQVEQEQESELSRYVVGREDSSSFFFLMSLSDPLPSPFAP